MQPQLPRGHAVGRACGAGGRGARAPVERRHGGPGADGAGRRVVARRRAVLAAKVDEAQVQRVPARLPPGALG